MWGGLSVRARAKVNLGLDVLGRRADGYHELLTFLSAIELADRVILEPREAGIKVECAGPGVPGGPDNLAWRAAEAVREASGVRAGVRIRIAKAIPVAAGLGGGSTDAAAVLVGASRLWGLDLSRGRLAALATTLGMDVPFFLGEGPALASGRGERLEPVRGETRVSLVLVNPGFPLATREVYARLASGDFGSGDRVRAVRDAWPDGAEAVAPRLANTLESAAARLWPGLPEIKEALLRAGALGAVMSGSGPTVLGVAASPRAARAIRDALADRPWRTWVTRTVPGPALTVGRLTATGGRGSTAWGVAKR